MWQCELFTLACYSSWAYHTEYMMKKPGVFFVDCEGTGVQYYLIPEEKRLTVVFRGTDSIKDLIWDAAVCQRTAHPCRCGEKGISKVHRGFYTAYEESGVGGQVSTFIAPSIQKVVLTGHSYGAALAVLCAADLQSRFPGLPLEVAVFGCPRVGNRVFRRAYNACVPHTLRVENGNDAVTWLPIPVFGYRHVGTALPLGKKRRWWRFSLADHAIKNYVEQTYREDNIYKSGVKGCFFYAIRHISDKESAL